jgi:response regulator NasT
MRFKQNQSVQAELNNLRTTLADRKVIDRAKGMIMAQRACTEDEAYKLLRTTAMNQNIRLAALAQNIIDAAQLLDPKVG